MSILFEDNKTPLNADNLNKLVSTTPQSFTESQKQQARTNIGAGSVTGVKGNAESAYRTGNVSLTAENIGALTIEQWTALDKEITRINERIDDILRQNPNIVE